MTRRKQQNGLLLCGDESFTLASMTSPGNEGPGGGHVQPVCMYVDLVIPRRAALDAPIQFAVSARIHAKILLLLMRTRTSLPRRGNPPRTVEGIYHAASSRDDCACTVVARMPALKVRELRYAQIIA